MRRVAAFLLLLGCGGGSPLPLDASVDGAASDAAKDAKDAASDACVQPSPEGCGEPCPGSFVPKPLVLPAPKSVCTGKQIDELWATCFAAAADRTACQALVNPGDPCTACLWTSESNAPWGALAEDANQTVRPNVPGCLEVTSADPSCGNDAEALRQCEAFYCSTACWPYDPTKFPSTDACVAKARAGFCASFAAKACAPADAGPTAQCAGDDFHASYVAIAKVLCAAPVKDAGAD